MPRGAVRRDPIELDETRHQMPDRGIRREVARMRFSPWIRAARMIAIQAQRHTDE
jgi:hypothetical protein